jgi:hypothetical protein
MCQIQGHYWGKTWVGATPPCRVAAQADAVLVAPTHVLPEADVGTGTVLTEYRDWPQSRPQGEQP